MAPLIGMIFFILIFNGCVRIGLDTLTSFVFGVSPGAAITLFVLCMVNDRPPRYAIEMLQNILFKLSETLYLNGYSDRPPQIWRKNNAPNNPRQ